jgi:exodeoxyribonuclease V alpha subunit
MLLRNGPLIRTLIVRIVDAVISRLRYAAARKKATQSEQKDPLARQKSSVIATLQQALREGHTCLSQEKVIHFLCSRHREIAEADAVFVIGKLSERGDIRCRNGTISLPNVACAEETIAHRLRYIGKRLRRISPRRLAKSIDSASAQLNNEQRAAVTILASSRITILTGDPGTGKTVTIKALAAVLEQNGYILYLTAPTGRAAARLTEATGRPAQTLHRLLHNHERRQPLRELLIPKLKEAVIVDEASMVDLFLAERLVEFCTLRTKLILVGDVNQLHPVGPGQVFRDLIESGHVPVIELTNSMRQSSQSPITAAARHIKSGIVPELVVPGESKSDCYFIEAGSARDIQRLVVNVVTRSLPGKCAADPHRDIQVLTPMHKGALGTIRLNELIRAALNQEVSKADISVATTETDFHPNDRVLQTRNNYNIDVFNGECGIVETVDDETITVRFGDKCVAYDQDSLADLTSGYAITIHRSQGSEYPFVIIPIHESQGIMLARELLYTAITRARRMVVLIGSRRAIARAVSNTRSIRLTGLKYLLTPSTTKSAIKREALTQEVRQRLEACGVASGQPSPPPVVSD